MAINKALSVLRYKQLIPLFEKIHKYPYAHIKGEVLSYQSYDDFGKRHIGDIDLLIPRSYIKKIETELAEFDFVPANILHIDKIMMLSTSHQTTSWGKYIPIFGHTEIDLNLDILWGEYMGKRINIPEFLSDTIEMEIYGCKVKTLSPLKALIQLVLHHYKDMNSLFLLATRKSIKYAMFKDIYYLLKNNLDSITLDKLYTMSSEYKIIPYVFYVLYYTGQVFEDTILNQYIETFRTPEGEALLNCYGLCAKEQKEWKCDFKTRLEAENLYDLIKNDLTEKDKEKIAINKRVFLGVSE